ncbi:MAG: hypothetical protein ACEQSA_06820, partial [Weeksellaceae bacterium]
QKMKDVLVFHYLPILWYRYPIPNEIREFWYNERPDILDYMQKAYKDFDIQFLPDRIIKELNQKILTQNFSFNSNSLITQSIDLDYSLNTELLSTLDLSQSDNFLSNLNFLNANFHNLVLMSIEKLF